MSFTMQRTVEGGHGFAKKVGVVFIFCARYTRNDAKCPPNCQHLPMPMLLISCIYQNALFTGTSLFHKTGDVKPCHVALKHHVQLQDPTH